VESEDERRILRNDETLGRHVHTLGLQLLDLGQQRPGVDDHTVADHGELSRTHDAGGQKAQLVGDAVDHERVAGIVAALEAHDHIGPRGQPVHNLAFAFVAPLGADHRHVRHCPYPDE